MTPRSKGRPQPPADDAPWHTTLAGAFGEAIGRRSDRRPADDAGAPPSPPDAQEVRDDDPGRGS